MYALSMHAKRVIQAGQRIRLNKRRCQIRLFPKIMLRGGWSSESTDIRYLRGWDVMVDG
jgi:hypothetical protein